MVIARKPGKTGYKEEKKIIELIEKGGSVADNESQEKEREVVQVFFRAPAQIIRELDRAAKSRRIPSTRQNWLLEAIIEKLERDSS